MSWNEPQPTDRVEVTVFDTNTGKIRQVVKCSRQDAHVQHLAFADHHYVETTGQSACPKKHSIDLKTKRLTARDVPIEETQRNAAMVIDGEHARKRQQLPDLTLLTAKAVVGGEKEKQALSVAIAAWEELDQQKDVALKKIAAATDHQVIKGIKL